MFEDTIAAVSTSMLSAGAISIVRLSGRDCFDVLDKVFRCRTHEYEGYRIYYGHIIDPQDEEVVDEVLVSIF
ncbi:MAG: tRNA uridine-5-carboxymethylaminomethyl(34) synthesis GTPase MnmE, partial [Erysipelotrichaceae bacterium]|nr:tRNA uridine-5-carboxymethylaminomethyl(34) synthesis GTPase MnmE [Erysipelotrichaceae bacterium]